MPHFSYLLIPIRGSVISIRVVNEQGDSKWINGLVKEVKYETEDSIEVFAYFKSNDNCKIKWRKDNVCLAHYGFMNGKNWHILDKDDEDVIKRTGVPVELLDTISPNMEEFDDLRLAPPVPPGPKDSPCCCLCKVKTRFPKTFECGSCKDVFHMACYAKKHNLDMEKIMTNTCETVTPNNKRKRGANPSLYNVKAFRDEREVFPPYQSKTRGKPYKEYNVEWWGYGADTSWQKEEQLKIDLGEEVFNRLIERYNKMKADLGDKKWEWYCKTCKNQLFENDSDDDLAA